MNPIFWALTIIWFVAHPPFLLEIFPAPVYYVGLALWVFGNFALWYLTVLRPVISTSRDCVICGVLVPVILSRCR